MIIKSHVRGGYRAAAAYLGHIGDNEKVRLVEISDAGAKNLEEAFRNMWAIGSTTRARKPLHHVSINPRKDERLTNAQVLRICERLEDKYGYAHGEHQRVIVEHVKDGRQHFHVMWNRVSLRTGRPVWPGHHWNKSKQAAREMEKELGLRRPASRRQRRIHKSILPTNTRRASMAIIPVRQLFRVTHVSLLTRRCAQTAYPTLPRKRRIRHPDPNRCNQPAMGLRKSEMSVEELIAWAWENRRSDILAQFGIYVSFEL